MPESAADLSLVLTLTACAFMTGLIWFVQVVHYPLMARVGEDGFAAYARSHQRLTTLVVGPAMLIEAGSAAVLLATEPGVVVIVSSAALGVVWLSTFFVQVPLHTRLLNGRDERVLRRLVSTNWIRTAAWSGRLVLLAWLTLQTHTS